MCEEDREVTRLLDLAAMDGIPDRTRAETVRERTIALARRPGGRVRRYRIAATIVAGALVTGGAGLAATQAGRDFIRHLFTPVQQIHAVEWQAPDGSVWSHTGSADPYAPEEQQAVRQRFAEIDAIKTAGGGRLVGLIEGPPPAGVTGPIFTTYLMEYTLADGETTVIGSGMPTGQQAANLRMSELARLRDAGAGEVISQRPFPIGLAQYVLRFTLSDGQTVDLQTNYPPGTAEERERIFAETRQLKAALQFTVLNASRTVERPRDGVWGILRYTLADGRIVGMTEQVPQDVVSEDRTEVVQPETHEVTETQTTGRAQ